MEKREGYKKTEIGWIPEGWDVRAIGSFSKSSSLKNTASKVKNVVSVTKYDGIVNSLSYFKKQVYSQNIETYKIIKKDEFAYATIHLDEGSIGVLAHCEEAVLSPMYTVFSIDLNVADRDFFMGLVKSERMMNIYQHIGAGSINRRKSIPFSTFSKIQMPFPPLPEQKKIASILTTVDDKISSIEHQIQQTEQLKKGLMEKLLTEGIGHTEFKETKIGRIPKEWGVKKLSSYCEKICVGFVGTCEKYYTDETSGVLMLRTGNLQSGKLRLSNLKYVSTDFHNKNVKSQIQPEDLIIARHGSSGQAVLIPKDFSEANCLNIVIVRPDNREYLPLYLTYLFNSSIIQKQIQQKTAGSTQGVVNTKEISNTIFLHPSLDEQNQIATILSTVDDKIEVLTQKKTQYQTLKQGLSQQLLTGQMRVKI